MDFAARTSNHQYRIDPIVRHLGDVDFYEFAMGQLIHEKHFNEMATFAITNRTKSVRLADIIDETELREQLDYVRTLRFDKSFMIWLRGQNFYGREGIFKPAYLDFLARMQLPEYKLVFDRNTGEIDFRARGRLCEVMWWETIVMDIINTMRNRTLMRGLSKSDLDITYARAKVKLYAKLERLAKIDDLNLTDFGTRRRHDFLWQEHCVLTACEVLGSRFTGTSNMYLAYRHGLDAKGTNSHIIPMAYAALSKDDTDLKASQYSVLQDWQTMYRDNMLVFLPDTFGTTQFLKNAPQWIDYWKGARPDSKDAFVGGDELINFWKSRALDPTTKLIIFSDGMDVSLPGHKPNGTDICAVHDYFKGRVGIGFGFGTMLTNDFIGAVPRQPDLLKPISLVCKVVEVNGKPTVKLSDVSSKAIGPKEEIARYQAVFGQEGILAGDEPKV